MNTATIYEHPLGERIRTLLRLEHLFKQSYYFHEHSTTSWDSRMVLLSIFEILELFSRADLKTEIVKEIDRANANLENLLENPQVDSKRLSTILKALQRINGNLLNHSGQLGQSLRDDPFLNSIRQRSSIPGGTCDFDLPAYHQWLQSDIEKRQELQQQWLSSLDYIKQAVELLLKLIRNSAEPHLCNAHNGLYQQQLDSSLPFQLIRLFVTNTNNAYPEISGSKHRFNIRFLTTDKNTTTPVLQDVEFQLALCML